MRCFSTLFW